MLAVSVAVLAAAALAGAVFRLEGDLGGTAVSENTGNRPTTGLSGDRSEASPLFPAVNEHTSGFQLLQRLIPLLGGAVLAFVPQLHAQQNLTPIATPVDAYVNFTVLYQSGQPRPASCGNLVNSIVAPGGLTVIFSYPTMITWMPECEANVWGTPPEVESAIPVASFNHSFTGFAGVPAHHTLVLTPSQPSKVFGFEAAPLGWASPVTVTATFKNGADVLGVIAKSYAIPMLNYMAAQLIAGQSDTPITSVELTAVGADGSDYNLYLAQIRSGQGVMESVEVTQAIQQYQTLDDLKTSLRQTHDPPVPIVSGKPAALRVYLKPFAHATKLQILLSNVANQAKTQTFSPNCSADNQRLRKNGCFSSDFYFTPQAGNWTAHLDVLDSRGTVVEGHDLAMRSWDTDSVLVRTASVCDGNAGGHWQCQKASSLSGGMLDLLKKILPTEQVNRQVTNRTVRRDLALYFDGPSYASWWADVNTDLSAMYGGADQAADAAGRQWTVYFGMVRTDLPGGIGGMAAAVPSHAAASRKSTIRLGQELNFETLAHEVAHTLGVKHTNVAVAPAGAAPGCYNRAADPNTDWTYGDNRIQSTARLEVGFDVARKKPLDPNTTFDIGSYCTPRWIAPLHYKAMVANLTALGVPLQYAPTPSAIRPDPALAAVRAQSAEPRTASRKPAALTAGLFWRVQGTIQNGAVNLQPLFAVQTQGSTDAGSGTYSIEVQDATGALLFVRYFTPQTAATESTGIDASGPPSFSETIPVSPTAAAIVVKDSAGAPWQRLALGGTAPTVTIASPAAGFVGSGDQVLSWTFQGSGSSGYTSLVQYSADNGSSWTDLGEVQDASMDVDFGDLPGSPAALVRVLVSDGANTGTATSVPFTVPKKAPQTPEISEPPSGSFLTAADPILLSASAFDPDDGDLSGTSLQWSSNLQGALGSGADLSVQLQPGQHILTLTAKDSDGNTASATTTITVVDQPPVVTIMAGNQPQATINAVPGSLGAPLSAVQYSTNGGSTWTSVPLGSLPLDLTFSQTTRLLVQAIDAAGQSDTEEASVLQPPLVVSVSPSAPAVVSSDSQQFTATVTGTSNTAVIWSVALGPDAPPDARAGSISSTGLYFAPDVSSAYAVVVTATSQADYRTSASARVLLQPESITPPSSPSGPSTGVSGALYQFTASGGASSLGHALQYTFFWNDGSWSGWTPPGVTISFHSWSSPGTYYVFAQARCTIHTWEISDFSDPLVLTIGGESVSTSDTPNGPASGITNTSYSYATGHAISSAGSPVQYRLYWGDGSFSAWLPVGIVSASHAWFGPGTYQVTAQARSASNPAVLSSMSSALTVVVTANETIGTPTTPTGPAVGTVGVANTYSTGGATSSLGNPVRYLFDWGDGTTSGWLAAGGTTAPHAWSYTGSFTVTVIAADANNLLIRSDSSGGITVAVQ